MPLPPINPSTRSSANLTNSRAAIPAPRVQRPPTRESTYRPRTNVSRQWEQERSRGLSETHGNSKQLYESLQDSRKTGGELRSQVTTLEGEVRTLKARLDGLRKAKTQTIIKRQSSEEELAARTQAPCKCEATMQELERKMAAKQKEWEQEREEMEKSREEAVSTARREGMRSRPKTASRELLAVSQAEVTRLRAAVADLEARLQCQARVQPKDSLGELHAAISRRLDEFKQQVRDKEVEFAERERKVQLDNEERCKRNHELWMKDAQEVVKRLADENKELRKTIIGLKQLPT